MFGPTGLWILTCLKGQSNSMGGTCTLVTKDVFRAEMEIPEAKLFVCQGSKITIVPATNFSFTYSADS